MISDDRERQFDTILDVADSDTEALLAASRQIQRNDPEMGANLRLIAMLRGITPDKAEIDTARLRIGQRLTRDILADPDEVDTQKHGLRPLRLSEPPEIALSRAETGGDSASAAVESVSRSPIAGARRMSTRRRIILGAVAAAALLLALGAGLTTASAQSLPESPLYGVKRAEESILLALSMSDDARAQTLGMIAERRLLEAQAEDGERHEAEVAILLGQYNDDMRQLIMLAASVNAHHGDSSAITAQIAQVLQMQQDIQRAATAQGDRAFMKALNDSAAAIAATLRAENVTLPNANDAAGQNNGKNHDVATATPTFGPTPTTPGSSGSHSHGNGHGNSHTNDGGSGANVDH